MISLDATTKSLEFVLGAAHTTNALEYNIIYCDIPSITQQDYSDRRKAHTHGQSNGTTTVTMLAAPSNALTRNVEYLSVHNKDTIQQTVTIKVDISTTERILLKTPLRPDETLIYTDGGGWQIL